MEAYSFLALPKDIRFRIGPIPEEDPPFIPYKGYAIPTTSQRGGAPEIYIDEPLFLTSTLDPAYLLGIYDLKDQIYLKPCCEIKLNKDILVKSFRDLEVNEQKLSAESWKSVKTKYEYLKETILDFSRERNLSLRLFPWYRPEVNLVGGSFSINLGFTEQEISGKYIKPIWITVRSWIKREKFNEEIIDTELSYEDRKTILLSLQEAYNFKE
ncbi:MAG: hypothetical protein QXX95_07380 [Nitrososphaerales archaeon]